MTEPKWNIAFMGTPEFAIPPLLALIQHENVIAVYTQPDRPKGRGQKVSSPPVRDIALHYGIRCFQVGNLQSETAYSQFKELKPDLTVVAAYGLFLPKHFLTVPTHKTINIHPSLVPKYRGAAPIQWALINGDTQTGVSVIYVTPKMDAGDILTQESLPIDKEDTLESLQKKLSQLSAALLIKCISSLKKGEAKPFAQDERNVIIAPKLTKDMGNIQWQRSAIEISCLIRGANPWPGTFTFYKDELLKIHAAKIISTDFSGEAGKIHSVSGEGICVETPKGLLSLTEIQKPNKKRMSAADFLKGHTVTVGSYFSNKKSC